MIISNDSWTWGTAARKAHALSLCNPGVTYWACLRPNGEWCITDNQMVADASEDCSAHCDGQRVDTRPHVNEFIAVGAPS